MESNFDPDALAAVLQSNGGMLSEQVTLPPRPPVYAPIPARLPQRLRSRLAELFPQGLYSHQSRAIEIGLAGDNICLATPTASGKTVAFASVVLGHLGSRMDAKALVLYPAKALVADQLDKWQQLSIHLGLTTEVIDGSVLVKDRDAKLAAADIVLMTPDVVHAWLLGRCDLPGNAEFLSKLEIAVLDEAHSYEGVFGTNMMFLLRRLRAASSLEQVVASTATIASPEDFLRRLTGLQFRVIGSEDDGAAVTAKTFMHFQLPPRRLQSAVKDLVLHLASVSVREGKFIAFVDSRKQVEELVALAHSADPAGKPVEEEGPESAVNPDAEALLPYRSGYEEEDRKAIQKALATGKLAGVIATSALELGIDIGEVSTVVMVSVPGSMKSFWQRAGRAGRRAAGRVLVLDTDNAIKPGSLSAFLQRPAEANWLYADNEFLQFTNALCAAEEVACLESHDCKAFADLPETFLTLLDNELHPTRPVPQELYPLKQQAASAAKPHLAFPVRTGIQRQYTVIAPRIPGMSLGRLDYSQLLREAFPGAIYRYMAKPYRVYEIKHGAAEIRVNRIKGIGKTTPNSQAMAFPAYPHGVYACRRSDEAFLLETRMQVSERVTGFTEVWGAKKESHRYGVGSTYAQKPLARHFETTGVCLHFSSVDYNREVCARYLARAFCRLCSVHERDVGIGGFSAGLHPLGSETVGGMVVYDSTEGSLRLTRQFLGRLPEIFDEAAALAQVDDAQATVRALERLKPVALACVEQPAINATPSVEQVLDEWIEVVANGQKAVLHDGVGHIGEEVQVERFAYTPQGPVYFLKPVVAGAAWRVAAGLVKPLPGESQTYRYNLNTGETQPPA